MDLGVTDGKAVALDQAEREQPKVANDGPPVTRDQDGSQNWSKRNMTRCCSASPTSNTSTVSLLTRPRVSTAKTKPASADADADAGCPATATTKHAPARESGTARTISLAGEDRASTRASHRARLCALPRCGTAPVRGFGALRDWWNGARSEQVFPYLLGQAEEETGSDHPQDDDNAGQGGLGCCATGQDLAPPSEQSRARGCAADAARTVLSCGAQERLRSLSEPAAPMSPPPPRTGSRRHGRTPRGVRSGRGARSAAPGRRRRAGGAP